jgi:hypothetical protein
VTTRKLTIAVITGVALASALLAATWASAGTTPSRAAMPQMDMSHMSMPGMAKAPTATSQALAAQLAAGRLATAKYATDLNRAKQDGYSILTRDIPDMGWHFINPKVTGFNIRKPPILVYNKRGNQWQLGAFEWVFPTKPAKPPLPGGTYGSFGAACHYKDGTFVFEAAQTDCAPKSPQTGAAFNFWHPDLVTFHVWLWYPNPNGLFSGMNPLSHPFNAG